MTDRKLWLLGAATIAFGLVLGNVVLAYIADAYYASARIALLIIPAAVAYFVAYKSNTPGVGRVLLYIPLLAALAVVLTLIAWIAGVDTGSNNLAGLATLTAMVAALFTPPILLGACLGWLARRARA